MQEEKLLDHLPMAPTGNEKHFDTGELDIKEAQG
jgi:hypothetical protein